MGIYLFVDLRMIFLQTALEETGERLDRKKIILMSLACCICHPERQPRDLNSLRMRIIYPCVLKKFCSDEE